MSTTGRRDADTPATSDVAARLREAAFVRLVAAAHGDALAATGILARTLAARDCPFQASVVPATADPDRATDADCTVTVGRADATSDVALDGETEPASAAAADVARELGEEPPAALELAGAVADGRLEGNTADGTSAAGFERRPGVAVPTVDLADGLAHSTLVRAPFSGDREAAETALGALDLPGTLDEEDHRRVASLVAVRAVEDAPPRAGTAVERALHPVEGGPFETIGGYADVLDAVARERPGTGVALAVGHDVYGEALDAWRAHARRAHAAVSEATTSRYDGLFVARTDAGAPLGTAARLLHDFRSPEPTTLVVADGRAALLAETGEPGPTVSGAAAAVGATAGVAGRTGYARFDVDATAFVAAIREAQR